MWVLDEPAMARAGAVLAAELRAGDVIALAGPLVAEQYTGPVEQRQKPQRMGMGMGQLEPAFVPQAEFCNTSYYEHQHNWYFLPQK